MHTPMSEIIRNLPLKLPEKWANEARNHLENWLRTMENLNQKISIPPKFETAILTVFALSDFVVKTSLRTPLLLSDLIDSGDLLKPYLAGTHMDRLSQWFEKLIVSDASPTIHIGELPLEQIESKLRQYRQREMVRIAFRDLAGWSDLKETLLDLSELADGCIQFALSYLTHRYIFMSKATCTVSPSLVILGMGKLGAKELNFSSDVDLIFAFPGGESGQDLEAKMDLEKACLQIGRQLVQLLSRNTNDGFVFRVDTRLRPYGDSGPLVMSFDNLESYYQAQGREWERYALIKARVVAGDSAAGKELSNRLRPFVYRRYLDFGAFESIREMKEKVRLEVRRKGMQDNIKLGPGGIREVEFFGQIFQLIRGGVVVELQERSILKVLDLLAQNKLIPLTVGQELSDAYIFLRRAENRLQAMDDQQTHNLPSDINQRQRLTFSMGFESWADFNETLDFHRNIVHRHFNELLGEKESGDPSQKEPKEIELLRAVWQNSLDPEDIISKLAEVGFDSPKSAAAAIERFRNDSNTRALSINGRHRLNRLMPWIFREVAGVLESSVVLDRIFDLLKSIQRRTSYLALMLEYPNTITHLVRLTEASPWIVTFLGKHPVLLDELLDPRTLYSPPTTDELLMGLKLRIEKGPEDDFEYRMEALRVFKQVNVLRVAASEITNVLPLMNVSDRLSEIAQIILDRVVEFSWQYLVAKHGQPLCQLDGQTVTKGFAVIAYGKLGGLELGYGSDLDLVFLHCAAEGQTQGGRTPIDNTQFFARLGQRVIHILSAHTAAGVLYEVDMRLRPSGSAGVLVSHVNGYYNYQLKDAWTWEHQALIRARAVCGCKELMTRFETIRKRIIASCGCAESLKKDVANMRFKMRQQHKLNNAHGFDLKQGVGGMVDIEFLVQYLVLRYACKHPKLLKWTDNVRLLQSLADCGIIDEISAYRLRRAYLVYRAVIHRCNLQEKSANVDENRFLDLRQWVQKNWNFFLT